MIVVPASRDEYMKCLRAGLVERFMGGGAMVESPCCGPCMGGSFGLLGAGERCLATSNRNFVGEAGKPPGLRLPSLPPPPQERAPLPAISPIPGRSERDQGIASQSILFSG